jgi:hypothetical protein
MYSSPEKLPDGRYFVRADPAFYLQLPSVTVGELGKDEVILHGNLDKMLEVDQQLIKDAVENSVAWFSKQISQEVIHNYYQSAVEDSTVQVSSHKPVFFGINKEVTKTPPASGSVCAVLLQLEGLWFLKRSFGPVWKLVQVRERRQVEPVKCLIDSDDE